MNDQLSVIEDLTPEPENRGGGRWREVVLGVILLALVIGFAAWQWAHAEYQSGRYRAGQDAMTAHEWQSAIDYFQASTGYLDSDDLRTLATKELAHAEEVYEKGIAFAESKNWIAAMQTLGELKEDKTNYKDTYKVWDEAKEQVYTDALQGTVVARLRGNSANLSVVPMGSKYNDFGGWYPLLNSDSYSKVLGGCTDDKILYDIAGKDWTPRKTYSSDPNNPPTPKELLEGRVLVVGNLLTYTDPDFLKLSVDPSAYDRFLCGRTGLWLYDYGTTGRPGYFGDLQNTPVRNAMTGYNLTYASFDGTISQTFAYSSTTTAHEIPVAIDFSSDRMVVAKWSGEDTESGLITQETAVDLYLVTVDGISEPKLIFQTKWNGVLTKSGGIQSVQISPNGRYVMVNEFVPLTVPGKHYETEVRFIIDTNDPKNITSPKVAAADLGLYPANWIASGFVSHGVFAGNIITSEFTGSQSRVQMTNPAKPGEVIAEASVDAFTTGLHTISPIYWTVAREDFDGITLVGREEIRDSGALASLVIATITISADGKVVATDMVNANGWLRPFPFLIAGNRLVYTSDLDNQDVDWEVWSLPIAGNTDKGDDGGRVYGFKYDISNGRQPYDSVALGPKLMAYLDGNSMHALSYDGKYDVLLEDGITSLNGNWSFFDYAIGLK